jgi:hypothetical protein
MLPGVRTALFFHDIHSRAAVDRTLLMTRLLLAPIFRAAEGFVWEWIYLREDFGSVIVTYIHLVRSIDPPGMGKRGWLRPY